MKSFFDKLIFVISSIAFSIMLIVICINVFSRFFMGKSFSSAEEIAFMGFTYCVMFGACILYKRHGLIAIDIVVERFSKKTKQVVNIATFALLTVANAYLTYLSIKLSISAWARPTPALRIPYTYIDISAVIAFLILTIQSIKFFIDAVHGKELKDTTIEDIAKMEIDSKENIY